MFPVRLSPSHTKYLPIEMKTRLHLRHGWGEDGAKCGAKLANTNCAIKVKVTSASEMSKKSGAHANLYGERA